MNILLTGATGFIGQHLLPVLHDAGHSVRALVLPAEDPGKVTDYAREVVAGDISDPKTLSGLASDMDAIIHLAARVTDWGPRQWFESAIIEGTHHLLEEGKRAGIRRFVFASSIAAMGVNRHLTGFSENAEPKLTGIPYGDTKLLAEGLLIDFCQRSGIDFVVIRPTNVTGAGSVWVRDPIRRMRSGPGLPLIDGGQYPACLVSVHNLAQAFSKAVSSSGAANQVFFLRDDWPVTWHQYLHELGEIAGTKPRGSLPFGLAWRLGDLMEGIFNPLRLRAPVTRLGAGLLGRNLAVTTAKARNMLGWESRKSYVQTLYEIEGWINAGQI